MVAHKRVFVVGGTGFIGGHLIDRLIHMSADVKLLVHETRPKEEKLVGLWGDVSKDYQEIKNYLYEFKPQVIFYLAAQPIVGRAAKNPFETIDVNSRGSYLFLDACRNLDGVESIVYVSTDKVYGEIETIKDGDSLFGVNHPYNASKVMGDVAAQLYEKYFNLPITIIRNGNIYGPRDYHWDRLIPRTLKKIYHNESPISRGTKDESKRDYIYVDDLVDGLISAAYLNERKIINLGSRRSYSAYDVIQKLLKLCNKEIPIKYEPLWDGELKNQHFSNTNTSPNFINWKPKISFDKGLERTVKWYMEYFKDNFNG